MKKQKKGFINFICSLIPVSYTHLDVNKRQEHECGSGFDKCGT